MTANIIRLLILAGYLAGLYFLRRYLRENPPTFDGKFVYPETRPFKALWYLSGPLLLPLLALAWIFAPPISLLLWLYLALILPLLTLFLPWIWRWGVRMEISLLIIAIGFLIGVPLIIALLWIVVAGPLHLSPALLPALFFILSPPAFMLFLLYRWAPQILPLAEEEQETHRQDVAKLLTAFWTTFSKPGIVVVNGKAQTRVKGNPFLGVNPGLLITEPENAVVLRDGSKILNIVGPGVFFVGYKGTNYEGANVIHDVIDLYKQFRVEKEVLAITKDGIAIHAPISSIFTINGAYPPKEPGENWHYRKSAAYIALIASEVNPEGRTPLEAHLAHSWKDIPLQVAQDRLKQLIARYTLDEIYGTREPAPDELLRKRLGVEIKQHIRDKVRKIGIHVSGGGMGNKISPVDPEVTRQRIESWKANLMRQVTINNSEIEAAYLTQLGRIRGTMLSEILRKLTEQSERFQGLTDTKRDQALAMFLKLRLMETLEEIARNPEVEPLLSETAMLEVKRRHNRASEDRGGDI